MQHRCRRSSAKPERVEIGHYDWPDAGPENDHAHRPSVSASTSYADNGLTVRFRVDDDFVTCARTAFNDQVCEDSCCEFFVSPGALSHASSDYWNFEINAAGTMLCYHCFPGSGERRPLSRDDAACMLVESSLHPTRATAADAGVAIVPGDAATSYDLEFTVPWDVFGGEDSPAPAAGTVWSCNFYKCGDRTKHPHWGCWAPVGSRRPNFHRPEDFQQLIFS